MKRSLNKRRVKFSSFVYIFLAVAVVYGWLVFMKRSFEQQNERNASGQFALQAPADAGTLAAPEMFQSSGDIRTREAEGSSFDAPMLNLSTLVSTPTPTLEPTLTLELPGATEIDYASTKLYLEAQLSLTPLPTPTLEPTGWVWIQPVTVVYLTSVPDRIEVPVTVVHSEIQEKVVTRVRIVTPTATATASETATATYTATATSTPTTEFTPEVTPCLGIGGDGSLSCQDVTEVVSG